MKFFAILLMICLVTGCGTTCPDISFDPQTLPTASVGTTYNQTLFISAGTAPIEWKIISGQLPPGLSLTNGKISGTPNSPGTYDFTIQVTDATTCVSQQAYSIKSSLDGNWKATSTTGLGISCYTVFADKVTVVDDGCLGNFLGVSSSQAAAISGKSVIWVMVVTFPDLSTAGLTLNLTLQADGSMQGTLSLNFGGTPSIQGITMVRVLELP
ncbi:MAG: putative Ig domain-containing protein [Planctomycetes bacterium]|nr:putative Ig domain-containing protein [Planctomycetota bacterium]